MRRNVTHSYVHIALLSCIVTCIMLLSAGCVTVDRPDLPPKKTKQGTYIAKQKRCAGIPIGKPYYERVPTKMERTQETVRRPASWLLFICLPIGIIAIAASIVLTNPIWSKRCATVALIALISAVIACAWLLLSTYVLLFIPLVCVFVVWCYTKTKGSGIKWHREEK
jgi:hypothetical protein